MEREPAADSSLRLPLTAIAQKFIEYYWAQSKPFRSVDGAAAVLLQNTGPQAAVINALIERQQSHATLAAVRRDSSWSRLVGQVARTIRVMPLWKLQTVGSESDEFLYRQSEFADNSIRLLPGVPDAFRSLHGIVLDSVRGAWIRQIGCISANSRLLGDADLANFLFGSERQNLGAYASILREHQRNLCHYCQRAVRSQGVVDHFIAWSRYPADLGHNFVVAHAGCNSNKRDFLAHPSHVERWYSANIEQGDELAERFDEIKLAHDLDRSRAVALWAYEQGELAGAHVWLREKTFQRLDRSWRDAISRSQVTLAAEMDPPGYAD